jgi:hypothetical protein
MVDATADSGGNAIMLDSSILSKVSNICLVDTSDSEEMVDINRFVVRDGMVQSGILKLDDIRFFVEYCHFRGIEANVAGSIESYQAQQLWVLVPELDQCSTRGSASAVEVDPFKPSAAGMDTRQHRIIKRTLVRGLAPPEHGGVLNIRVALRDDAHGMAEVGRLRKMLGDKRAAMGWPALVTNYVDPMGNIVDSE